MKLTDVQRDLLLSTRVHRMACEHVSAYWAGGPETAYGTQWACDECPGGVPVAELCDTCDGGEAVFCEDPECCDYDSCPDCVGGIRLLRGELIEWCSVHESNNIATRCWRALWAIEGGAYEVVDCVFVTVYQVGPQ